MHVLILISIVCSEIMEGDNSCRQPGVCPKGRKHIGKGEATVYEKYQIHSPNGAAEIGESQKHHHGKKGVLNKL